MHRKLEAELLPLDTELEKIMRNLRKFKVLNQQLCQNRESYSKTLRKKQQQKGLRGKGL